MFVFKRRPCYNTICLNTDIEKLKDREWNGMRLVVNIIKDHIAWRHQIFKLAKADIVKTYSGAALGWSWAIVKPTITIFVYWFAFSIGLRLGADINGIPYILWLIAGIIPWFYMSDMITQGASAIRKYKFLVTKMKFPVATIPTFVSLSKFAIHLCLMVIVVVIYGVSGFFPDVYMLQLPFYMLCMFLFFTCWGLFSSMLSAMSKDFLNLVKSFTTAFFWISGIMWDVNRIDHGTLHTVLMFNPITYIVSGFRNVFVYKVWFFEEPTHLLYFCIVLVVMMLLAFWSYKKLIKEIPDVL